MPNFKLGRINEDVKRELTDIIRGVKDHRVNCFLTIVRVEITNDLSLCKVHISAFDGMDKAKKACEGLKSASGYIKHELSHRVKLRRIPEFKFIPDDGANYSAKISKILNDVAPVEKAEQELDNDED